MPGSEQHQSDPADNGEAIEAPPPTEQDDALAGEAILRMADAPASGTLEREALQGKLARLCAFTGQDRFRFLYDLREPRNRFERFEKSLYGRGLTIEQIGDEIERFAKRPIDMEMLTAYFERYEERLDYYATFFQAVARASSPDANLDHLPDLHRAAESAMKQLRAKFDLYSTELETVDAFLAELQSDRGRPVRLGEFSAHTAHWLAQLVFNRAELAWSRCHELEDLLLGETAARIFRREWIDTKAIPLPNDLAAILLLEQAAAKKALRERLEREAERRAADAAGVAKADQSTSDRRDVPGQGGGTSWQHVQARLLRLYDAGETYTSSQQLAERFGCSTSTIHKAIKNSRQLKGWQKRAEEARKRPKAVGFNEVHTDNAVQCRESDPAESAEEIEERDAILEELIRQVDGDPAAEADLRSRDTEELRELHRFLRNDPDRGPRILGRRP